MKKGFFSSNREGAKRDDIYYFELPDVNLNVVTYVKEKISKEPIAGATVTLTDDKGKTMDAISDKDGKVTFKLTENTAYKFYPNRGQNEYWLILKNKEPMPYANTKLNIHQLEHNNSLLEARILELEEEIKKLKGENVDNRVDNM
jgi:hypothetical protein